VVAVGVEWAERSGPAADRGGLPAADEIPIAAQEADRIVARIRRGVTGGT
jgi:hypothetical protein